MDATEAQVVYNLPRGILRLGRPDGAPVSDERSCEVALLPARQARRAFNASLGLSRSPSRQDTWWKAASWRCRPSQPTSLPPVSSAPAGYSTGLPPSPRPPIGLANLLAGSARSPMLGINATAHFGRLSGLQCARPGTAPA
jgi:hypothetical protein